MEIDENRRKTFTVEVKEDSGRWHNITDAELLNLANISDPCKMIDSHEISVESCETKGSTTITTYEEAIDEFLNLTIKDSPLNVIKQKAPELSTSAILSRSRRASRVPSPVKDYETMFDNLLSDLKKKEAPLPKLELDDFLEKLNIAPVKIPVYPQLQPGYIPNKIKELEEKHARIREEEKRIREERKNSQFPQIPSASFLIENKIEW
jgi:hypothetical protein